MKDTDLYQKLLGLETPWSVEKVDLNLSAERVDVWVAHPAGQTWPCPKCGKVLGCRDHAEQRSWRHLDSCQFKTYLHARIPRVECTEHGVVQVEVPWAAARSRFTALMERWIIQVLLKAATVKGACELLGLKWDAVWVVLQRAVLRGKERKQALRIPHLGVDEKAYETATRRHVPDAEKKIVFDRFHIMKHMVDAVDEVRRKEHKSLTSQGDETLKSSRYLWLYSRENVPERHHQDFKELRRQNLKVARAWAYKEGLRNLWNYVSPAWARKFFEKWYSAAIRSRLEPVKKVARMVKRRLENVLTYCKQPFTNATAEGINSKIMAIKRRAGGYRNPDHFETVIYFFCGGLDLDPR